MPAWLLPALMGGAAILGGAGKGASAERANANNYAADMARLNLQGQQANNQNLLQALLMNERGTMDRAQLGLEAPNARIRQALLGSMLQGAQSTKVTPPKGIRMGTVSGGMDVSALLNAALRGAGGTLQGQATRAIETGSDVPPLTDARQGLTRVDAAPAYQKAGKTESLLSLLGLLSSGGAAGMSAWNAGRAAPAGKGFK